MKTEIIAELSKVQRTKMGHLIEYLVDEGFFKQSCSTKYHLNYEGGLAEHSWNVFKLLQEKNARYKLGLSKETMIVTALLHDICKIHSYKLEDGKHVWNNDSIPIGHGEKSVIMIQRFIKLTDQEICMIRWHMGPFETNLKEYNSATNLYPEIVALFTSDYESTKFLEKD